MHNVSLNPFLVHSEYTRKCARLSLKTCFSFLSPFSSSRHTHYHTFTHEHLLSLADILRVPSCLRLLQPCPVTVNYTAPCCAHKSPSWTTGSEGQYLLPGLDGVSKLSQKQASQQKPVCSPQNSVCPCGDMVIPFFYNP